MVATDVRWSWVVAHQVETRLRYEIDQRRQDLERAPSSRKYDVVVADEVVPLQVLQSYGNAISNREGRTIHVCVIKEKENTRAVRCGRQVKN